VTARFEGLRYARPPLTRPRIARVYIPSGYHGTLRTVTRMKALIRAGARDFYVRQKAIDILLERRVRAKDFLGEIRALFEWVRRNVRYTKDPFRVEVLHSPRRMLELRAGDCDDVTVLLGAMLMAVGHPVRLVVVGPDPLRPRLFSHVYLEVRYRDRWLPLDATASHPMGWAPGASTKQVFAVEGNTAPESSTGVAAAGETTAVPEFVRSLVLGIRFEGFGPRDARVRSLWHLLRQRRLLGRSRWLRAILERMWVRGLPARPRPRTAQRFVTLLRTLGVLPPPMRTSALPRRLTHAHVRLRPVRPIRARRVQVRRFAPPAATRRRR
jgi:hypothetical protein